MKPKKALKTLYSDSKGKKFSEKATALFLIIQIKNDNSNFKDFKKSLYLDVKKFTKSYIFSADKKDFGYDKIEIEKITTAIEFIENKKERYELCLYASRLLSVYGFENTSIDFKKYKNKSKTELLKSKNTTINRLKLISHLCSYNLHTILLILLGIFILAFLIFLPTPMEELQIFTLDYNHYSENFYLNHFLNLISMTFDLENDKIVHPLNFRGVLVLAVLKSLYILVILNYLYQKILEIIYAS